MRSSGSSKSKRSTFIGVSPDRSSTAQAPMPGDAQRAAERTAVAFARLEQAQLGDLARQSLSSASIRTRVVVLERLPDATPDRPGRWPDRWPRPSRPP